ncbi:uncharacterized protein LOC131035954 isoform X2 [Cryptomeria japonica]|uniref:uncharacterized protein LOC131035954 isoform X2 n=1 Tax=Cryptomeria japonica TaxID=3369 RepID=UPI0025AD25CE|nr:uncharacterized protein LOC131035954 isoform X2 [Cryptomeria japonica]
MLKWPGKCRREIKAFELPLKQGNSLKRDSRISIKLSQSRTQRGRTIIAKMNASEVALGIVLTSLSAALFTFVFAGFSIAVQPTWMVRWFQKRVPNVLFIKSTQKRIVALTIDDGPHRGITEEILDILKQNGCRSTFFIIGSNMDNSPELVRRIVAEGHEVGNHTMHDVASWSLSPDVFKKQLLEVDDRLKNYFITDATQTPIKWFRPGHGFYTRKMIQIAKASGYRTALGSLFPLDTLFSNMGKHIAKYLLWRVHPGAIIILHDREPQAKQTAEVLRILLPRLKACGYSVVTLSELDALR